MSQNKFQETAEKGNQVLEQVANSVGWSINFSQDEYSVWDALITTPNKTYLAETKHRGTKYDDMIMEDKKMNNIINESKTMKAESGNTYGVLYINTFDDGTAFIWTINKELLESCESKVMRCPLTTSGYQKRVDKLVWMLPTSKAIKANYN